jgi:hypothetical protein
MEKINLSGKQLFYLIEFFLGTIHQAIEVGDNLVNQA